MSTISNGTAGTRWVSVEGPNGVGKTHLTRALAARLGPDCQLLTELTDAQGEHVAAQVIGALSTAGDAFLRTGHPLTETFALLALKVREHELVTQMLARPAMVLEDRGVDTVAIYQAAIMLGEHGTEEQTWTLAQQIYQTAAQWRPIPDLTLLITDDLDNCWRRWAEREGIPLTGEQQRLVSRVAGLYCRQAAHEPERFRIVARAGRDEDEILTEMAHLVLAVKGAH
ncbi:MAG: dTMP kinase [Pseudonocardiaceae bacterium]